MPITVMESTVGLRAQVLGVEVISKNLEESEREVDRLKCQLDQNAMVFARLLNELQLYRSHVSQPIPQASRPMVEALLEENQKLKQENMLLRAQIVESEHPASSERADELQAENDSLRHDVHDLKLVLDELKSAESGSQPCELLSRLERAERTANTRSTLCEQLAGRMEELRVSTCEEKSTMEEELRTLRQTVNDLQRSQEKLTINKARFEVAANELYAKVSTLGSDNLILQRRVEEQTTIINEKDAKLKELEIYATGLTQQFSAQRLALAETNARLAQVQAELDTITQRHTVHPVRGLSRRSAPLPDELVARSPGVYKPSPLSNAVADSPDRVCRNCQRSFEPAEYAKHVEECC